MPQEGEAADDEVEDWFHGNHDVDPNWLVDTFHKEEDPKDMELSQVKFIRSVWEAITNWVNEIQEEVKEQESEGAWDDVHGGELPYYKVKEAREEEIGVMEERRIWTLKPIWECWEKTGKAPVTVRWVDVNKGGKELIDMVIRCRLVARDFKGSDKDRDDLFAATPPIENKRLLLSRAATRGRNGKFRKLLFVDARKAHLNPKCEEEVYIELPPGAKGGEGMCGKLNYWLYGFRPAAAAWEKLYSEKLEEAGFKGGIGCGVVFYHAGERYTAGSPWR